MTETDTTSAAAVPAPSPIDRRADMLRTLAAACIVIASLKLASDLLVPVLLAAFFAMALSSLAERLQRAGVPATLATVLSFAAGTVLSVPLTIVVKLMMERPTQPSPAA